MAERLHALGSRVAAELLIELATRADCLAPLLAVLAAYAIVTPEMMSAANADYTPSHPLRPVP